MKQGSEALLGPSFTDLLKLKGSLYSLTDVEFLNKFFVEKGYSYAETFVNAKNALDMISNTELATPATIGKMQVYEAGKIALKLVTDELSYLATGLLSVESLGVCGYVAKPFVERAVKVMTYDVAAGYLSDKQKELVREGMPEVLTFLGFTLDKTQQTGLDYWKNNQYLEKRVEYRSSLETRNGAMLSEERRQEIAKEETYNMVYNYISDKQKFLENYNEAILNHESQQN
jgi:hypothetical protein